MNLKDVLHGIEGLKAKGDLNIEVTGIDRNSKNIQEGNIFVAIKGFKADGHKYIEEAINNGAKVIIIQNVIKVKIPDDVTVILSDNTRHCLAIASANFYGNPSTKFKLIGITGTKGKTTTTFMIKQILEKQGLKVGLIGTIANYICGKKISDSDRTTPESNELQKMFYDMEKSKVDVVIMEVSSQSLKLNRVDGCDFDIGVFTNFTKDHISEAEHPDMEDYFNSKVKLFNMCKLGYINVDDFNVSKLQKLNLSAEIKTYGIDNFAALLAKDITITNTSVDFKVKLGEKNERIKAIIPGRFSVYNALAAISVCQNIGVSVENIKEALLEVRVPGRSELVDNKKDLAIMIDYAHSPESLQNILSAVKSYTKGKVISVFGCGGDRDSSKRPIMGEISGKTADFTIITSDNPRTEKPEDIINQIENGIKKTKGKYICIVDRIEATKVAIEMATKQDIVVLAGKGHETYQEINGKKYDFDERVIVKDIINKV